MGKEKLENLKKSIKVLFVSHEYNIGGSSVSLNNLLLGIIDEYGASVHIEVLIPMNLKRKNHAAELFRNNNVIVHEMLYRCSIIGKYEKMTFIKKVHIFWNWLATGLLALYIKAGNYDLVCSNSSAIDIGARAARIVHIPHIFYIREVEGYEFVFKNKQLMRELFEASKYEIFVSKFVENSFIKKYNLKNYTQFYEGFIIDNYYLPHHEILNDQSLSFIQVGAYNGLKGTLDTIEMFHKLNEQGFTDWQLEFVGTGDSTFIERMQGLITEYHLDGQIKIGCFCDDIKLKLSSKDILIMNSTGESFGRVTVEGMLAGCLVIGKNVGGTKEIILPEYSGILYKNECEFVESVIKISKNRKLYKNIAKKGQKYAVSSFDINNTVYHFMEVARACIKE